MLTTTRSQWPGLLAAAQSGSRGAQDIINQLLTGTVVASAAERLGIDEAGIDAVARQVVETVGEMLGEFDSMDELERFVAALARAYAYERLSATDGHTAEAQEHVVRSAAETFRGC